MRRSSLYMLIAAVFLGLLAVFFARTFLVPSEVKQIAVVQQSATVPAVVAGQALQFGDKIEPAKLKIVQYPANALPPGAFRGIGDVLSGDAGNGRVAMRAIDANEIITEKSLSGKNSRLSTSALFDPLMRAVSLPLSDAGGAGGFIAAGDRVDVYVTRTPSNEIPPYTTLLLQNVRVLAVGQDSNPGKDKPEVVKTVTVAVTPLQAQKAALAQTIGTLTLSLRPIVDETSVRLGMARLEDLHDGPGKMVIPTARIAPAAAVAPREKPAVRNIEVEVIRAGKPTTYSLGPAK